MTGKLQERDPYFTRLVRIILGNSLLTNSNETWKRHRKLLEPAFHFEALEKYLGIFNAGAHSLCKKLMATAGAEVDVYPIFGLCTVHVLMSTIGGVDLDRMEPDACTQAKLVAEILNGLKTVSRMLFRPWTIDCIRWMTSDGRELRRLIEVCKNFTQRYFDLLRELLSSINASERTHWTSLHSEDFLEKTEFENLLLDEIMTLAVAGSETTAGAMGYMLALLGLHSEWQEKAWRELDQVFGSGGDFMRPVTMEDLSKLTVIDAIIKESLRLFPTVPVVPRLVAEDVPLSGGRHVAPRGCCVALAVYLMHRHPQLFPDPEKFDPGRFLPGGSATSRKSGSYLPFSTGPRRCLGGHFAIMEMKILLSTVLRKFRIVHGSSREELETILLSITSHPLTSYRVSCVPREISSFN